MYYTSIALLLTAALFSLLVQTLAGGLSSTNIHPHRHNDNRKDFLAKEWEDQIYCSKVTKIQPLILQTFFCRCHKNGVVCLYETTRPYFAEAMSSDIQFDKGVPVNQRVITFRGRKDMAMGEYDRLRRDGRLLLDKLIIRVCVIRPRCNPARYDDQDGLRYWQLHSISLSTKWTADFSRCKGECQSWMGQCKWAYVIE